MMNLTDPARWAEMPVVAKPDGCFLLLGNLLRQKGRGCL